MAAIAAAAATTKPIRTHRAANGLRSSIVAARVVRNFLFSSKEENSPLKVIDFGLSDFVKPDERLNDIVESVYYVAPEVTHGSEMHNK
ncbi:hypothetical protein ZWY2020_022917 [Hordeum vulgare]|nr:hypothetical protein ZWY2020_022917 [Hordeum vulgare]